MLKFDVTLSLGDGMRPGCLADASDEAQFSELSISIVDKNFLFTYSKITDIKGVINFKNRCIYILYECPVSLFLDSNKSKFIHYNNLKKKYDKFYVKPFAEYPVWRFQYYQNYFIENKFNKYDCEQWNL